MPMTKKEKTEIRKEKFKPHVICEMEATEEKIGAQKNMENEIYPNIG